MPSLIKILFLALMLVSCTSEDKRYRDTSALERPPALKVNKKADGTEDIDNSTARIKQDGTGLGSRVYLTPTTPPLLMIKETYDLAWETLGQGLKQSHLQITDREHDKGRYFVTYNPDKWSDEEEEGFFDKALGYFTDKDNDERYLLTVTAKGAETQVSAVINTEPKLSTKSATKNSTVPPPADGAEKLLALIYKTMSEPAKEKGKKSGRGRGRGRKD
ncbi:MAG: outer membrane protein assembly factor BamC [Methylococcales bacterium]|nr:MAG: outer membrane protein assembly factor BamC [Methylococcales bacterium]